LPPNKETIAPQTLAKDVQVAMPTLYIIPGEGTGLNYKQRILFKVGIRL
jgi:hypothetical protein